MATGYVVGGEGITLKKAQIKNIFDMSANNGLNKSFTFTDLGIPSGAEILSTVVHQNHSGTAEDVYTDQNLGWGWKSNTLYVRNFNARSSATNVNLVIEIVYRP